MIFPRTEEKQGSVKTAWQVQPLLGADNTAIKPRETCKTNAILVATTVLEHWHCRIKIHNTNGFLNPSPSHRSRTYYYYHSTYQRKHLSTADRITPAII